MIDALVYRAGKLYAFMEGDAKAVGGLLLILLRIEWKQEMFERVLSDTIRKSAHKFYDTCFAKVRPKDIRTSSKHSKAAIDVAEEAALLILKVVAYKRMVRKRDTRDRHTGSISLIDLARV